MTATWSMLTPPGSTGAIAIVELRASTAVDMDATLDRLGLAGVPPGAVKRRDLLGIDVGVVARWSAEVCHVMPHGGVGVVRSLTRRLIELGVVGDHELEPKYPEARDPIEERMLRTLARAASPLAIDLLLDQPRRWAAGVPDDPALNRVLDRLIVPPLVVAIGAANVGKSTLVNVLSGRGVSIVADEPGTTRDHVGVHLDLGGLVVRYLDTPGMRVTDDPIEREAQSLSLSAATAADLVLLMGDATAPPPELASHSARVLRVALRSDLGAAPWPHDLTVCAARGQGVAELVSTIREALVPQTAVTDPGAWRFWKDAQAPE